LKIWEYTRASVYAFKKKEDLFEDPHALAGLAIGEAGERWLSELNRLGPEGWELVTERFVSGGPTPAKADGIYWAEFSGTLKRLTAQA
jgi:hypothetical protein